MQRQHLMLGAICAAGSRGIAPRELIALVYDDESGGAEYASTCIAVMAFRLKRKGWIRSEGRTWRTRYFYNGRLENT